MTQVPTTRVRRLNDRPTRPDGLYVLYWMIAFRRTRANFALARAAELCATLRRPLVVFEPLRTTYPHASDRLHQFVLEGMADNADAFAGTPVTYLPMVERAHRENDGVLDALAEDACAVVTDDYPAFFLPGVVSTAAGRLAIALEAVDSNGILPVRAAPGTFSTAHAFRSYLQRTLRPQIEAWPADPDFAALPGPPPVVRALARWPVATKAELSAPAGLVATLPIDHRVGPAPMRGGPVAARRALARFVADALPQYETDARQPEKAGTSKLSPYLHFGHISSHEIFSAVMTAMTWTSRQLEPGARGARDGWWGLPAGAEAFLDQCLTWRELGFNMCATRPDDYFRYASLPAWAQATLARHSSDRREFVYTREAFEGADTHDPIWNAAQRQLLRDGWMHNYLRMLWGKKILEWSASPEEALDHMIAIMNRHAVDGRDPNSYSGYFWTLGRYDRPWGPERPVFGTVRYMSSENTMKKLRLRRFLDEYGRNG